MQNYSRKQVRTQQPGGFCKRKMSAIPAAGLWFRSPQSCRGVVRRAAVEFVKVPQIYNVIRFDLPGQRVSLVTSWFGVRKVGRWLAQHGWVLNQPVQPTEAPIHRPDFRRG